MTVLTPHNGSTLENPNASQIAEMLSSLSAPGEIAVLGRDEDTYVQTKPAGNGRYALEYQDGGLDKHYESGVAPELDQVIAAFQNYQRGDKLWREQFTWLKLSLYPAPNRSGYVPNRTKTPDNDAINIGWHKGWMSDGRAYHAECWAQDQLTNLTIFFSTRGLEDATNEALRTLLEREKLITYLGPERLGSASKWVDPSGNELWSFNIVVGDDAGTYVDTSSPLSTCAWPEEGADGSD